MKLHKLRRSIETMPRPAYIFLKYLLCAAAATLSGSLLLFLTAGPVPARRHLAVLLLENPDLSVSDVAEQCGFATPAYFTTVFRQEKNVTPREYRQAGREN